MMKFQIKCPINIIEEAKKNFDERFEKLIGKLIINDFHLIQVLYLYINGLQLLMN